MYKASFPRKSRHKVKQMLSMTDYRLNYHSFYTSQQFKQVRLEFCIVTYIVTVLCGALQASLLCCRRQWELKADLWLSPSQRPQEKTVKTEGERCKNKQMILALWRCKAAASFMCSHRGSHSCGQRIWCRIWSEKSLLHVLEFLSLLQSHNFVLEWFSASDVMIQ